MTQIPVRIAVKCLFNGQGLIDIEHDESVGFQLITTDDIDDLGVPEIIERIRQRVGENPVYLRWAMVNTTPYHEPTQFSRSFDIDVIGV